MLKLKKNLIIVCFVVILFNISFVIANGAFDDFIEDPMTMQWSSGSQSRVVLNAVDRVWSIINFSVNILAVSVLIYVGIKYMMASAEQRANLKESMGTFVIGVIIAFASTNVINFVINVLYETI